MEVFSESPFPWTHELAQKNKILSLAAVSEECLHPANLKFTLRTITLPSSPPKKQHLARRYKTKQVIVAGACSRTSHIVKRHPRTQQNLGLH